METTIWIPLSLRISLLSIMAMAIGGSVQPSTAENEINQSIKPILININHLTLLEHFSTPLLSLSFIPASLCESIECIFGLTIFVLEWWGC